MQNVKRIAITTILALFVMLFGLLITGVGYKTLGQWFSISGALAACGVLWILAGPAMLVAGLWMLVSLGRHRFPLWMGGAAAVVAGAVLVVGVLTYVIPCSGPS